MQAAAPSITRKYLQYGSMNIDPTHTGMFSSSHRITGLEIAAGILTYILGGRTLLGYPRIGTPRTSLHRDTWGKGPYKHTNQTKQSFGDPKNLSFSLPIPLPHLKGLACPCRSPVCSVSLLFIRLIGRCLTGGKLTLAVSPEPRLAASKSCWGCLDAGKGF